MPVRLVNPMLSVDAERLRGVDTRNVENLFGMWSGKTKFYEPTMKASVTDQVMQSSRNVQSPWKMVEGSKI